MNQPPTKTKNQNPATQTNLDTKISNDQGVDVEKIDSLKLIAETYTPAQETETPPVIKKTPSRKAKRKYSSRPKKKPSPKKPPPVSEPISEIPHEKFQIMDKTLCKILATVVPFALIAMLNKSPEWELTEAEKETLAPYWSDLVDKYFPQLEAQYGCEASLGIAVGMIAIQKSKILDPKKPAAPEKKKAPAGGGDGEIKGY